MIKSEEGNLGKTVMKRHRVDDPLALNPIRP